MPRSRSLQFVLPHSLHLKSWPSVIFSAAPDPLFVCFIFWVWIICSVIFVGFMVLQVLQTRYWELFFVIMIWRFLQMGQNWIVMFAWWRGLYLGFLVGGGGFRFTFWRVRFFQKAATALNRKFSKAKSDFVSMIWEGLLGD